jgi:hypothetical protein
VAEAETIVVDPATGQPTIRRGCDGCTLCCKVMKVPALEKPAGTWCKHCTTGAGCGIYETRPTECRTFICGYLWIPEISPEWKPSISRMVISTAVVDGSITIFVDPGRPDAWRRQPYYRVMQNWARRELAQRRWLVIRVQDRSIVIMPDHAVDLGAMAEDEIILRLNKPGEPGDKEPMIYAVKRDAWSKAALDVAQGLRSPMLVDGMRPGRRID